MNSIPIVSFVGKSGSGKTTVLEKVITRLVKKGYRVGIIKHDAHGFEIDHEGKDSWRHKMAGAKVVVLSSPKKVALVKDVKEEMTVDALKFNFLNNNLDIIITEGYKKAKNPKIEVIRQKAESVCKGDKYLIAYASDIKLKTKLPCLDINNAKSIANFIEKKFLKNKLEQKVHLMVNGKDVSLKPFIAKLLIEAVSGMIRSLKDCETANEIDIRIRE
ncbi:MAG: molybdopterin-guanine dinucleotide biosynthesis protein B [Deltaproteobacteria bacterium]|nr:molybdopterin-guanine dinucleotide biosynthesis protein B [Deltaproteobacteria bacterium]